jgi:hypothetical protein
LKGRKHGDTVTLATFQSWHRANPFTQGNPMNTRGLPNSCSEPIIDSEKNDVTLFEEWCVRRAFSRWR